MFLTELLCNWFKSKIHSVCSVIPLFGRTIAILFTIQFRFTILFCSFGILFIIWNLWNQLLLCLSIILIHCEKRKGVKKKKKVTCNGICVVYPSSKEQLRPCFFFFFFDNVRNLSYLWFNNFFGLNNSFSGLKKYMMQTLTSKCTVFILKNWWRTQWVGEKLFTLIYTEMYTFFHRIH